LSLRSNVSSIIESLDFAPSFPDDELPPVVIQEPIEIVTIMSTIRSVSLRNAPSIDQSNFITLLPKGTKLKVIEKSVYGKNIWRKVEMWVAEFNNGIQYLK